MDIDIAYFNREDVVRAFGEDIEDVYAFEVLDAEHRGELARVKTETITDDSRAFGAGRHREDAIETGELVGFVDEESAEHRDVAERLYSPIVDEATDEGCAVYVSRKTGETLTLEAKLNNRPEVELRSTDASETARRVERLLSIHGYSPGSVPYGEANALRLPGGVRVWAEF